jgi:hypothetical protein
MHSSRCSLTKLKSEHGDTASAMEFVSLAKVRFCSVAYDYSKRPKSKYN